MKRDDIIEILEWHPSHVEHGASGLLSRIERVVAVAVAAEREACAQIVQSYMDEAYIGDEGWNVARDILNDIQGKK